MDISIVIPTYNRKDKLKQCLESLFKQDYTQADFEIIVIDDDSRDGTEEILKELSKEHSNLRYFSQSKKGPATARNLGIKQAKGEIIGFTDNDCILSSGWIQQMVEAHRLDYEALAIGGLTKINAHDIKAVVSQFLSDGAIEANINGKPEVIFFPTCNVSLKKSYLNGEEFNELFPLPAGEDLEFFWRLFKKGYKFIYRQDIELLHNCHPNFKSFLKQAYMYGRGNYLTQHIQKDQPLLKEIKTQNGISFFFGLSVNFIKIPRFSYLLGRRLIRSHNQFTIYEKFQIYIYFALHKIMYLIGNMVEHIRLLKLGNGVLAQKFEKIPARPEFIILDITHKCNLKCNICEIRKDKPIQEFSTGEVKNIITQAIEWNVKEFVLSGGEPLIREDIFEILNFVKEKKYRIGILTNGILLNEEFIKSLLPYLISGTLSLSISLDALTPEIHDDIRGSRGSFEKTLNGLRTLSLLKEDHSNINFNVISIILNENLEELLPLANLLKSLNVNSIQFQPLLVNNLIMGKRSNKVKYWITHTRLPILDRVIDSLIEFKKNNPSLLQNSNNNLRLVKKYFRGTLNQDDVQCLYATKTMLIANSGDITTCFGAYGNIRRVDLKEIWDSEEIKYAREKVKDCKKPCLLPCFTDSSNEDLKKIKTFSSEDHFKITQLQIESTNKCNLNCSICWHALGKIEEIGELAYDNFKKIIDQFECIEGINLQGLGEPFLAKDIFPMIEYARGKGIAIWLATNGILLTEGICKSIIKSGLSVLRISIDARTPQFYSRIKVGSDINKVIENVNTLNRVKKEFGSEIPRLALNSVAMKSTINELSDLIRLAHELKISEVSLIPLVVFDKGMATKDESMHFYKDLFLKVSSSARELSESLGIDFVSGISMERHPDTDKLPQNNKPQCTYSCYINFKGDLSPCCNITSFSFGNLLKESFIDLWNSNKYKKFRTHILKNKPTCRQCNKDIEFFKILE